MLKNAFLIPPAWGQGFGPAAELPLGAELSVVAGDPGKLSNQIPWETN
jgi:hypothetical protein